MLRSRWGCELASLPQQGSRMGSPVSPAGQIMHWILWPARATGCALQAGKPQNVLFKGHTASRDGLRNFPCALARLPGWAV